VLGLVQLVDKAQADVDPRDICAIPLGMVEGIQVVARVGRFGPFIEYDGRTKSIPDDLSPDELSPERAVLLLSEAAEGPKELGTDPVSGLEVTLHKGRFGPYVQLGAQEEGSKTKPKRESLLPGMVFDDVDLSTALALLSLPRNVGPDSAGNPIMAHNGRFGPYIKAGEETRTLPPPLTPLSVTHAQALELLAQPRRRASQGAPAVMREVGRDPDGRTIVIKQGRFGPYATDGEVNATIPKSANPESISIEAICEMLAAKRSAEPSTKPKRGAGRGRPGAAKTAAKKADADGEKATKKAPAKKAASAKAAPKKATKKPTKE
jgi:DNA topoisomerase-1